jgi:hypothetical protein
MECELVAQREQMAAKQREHMEEKEKLKRLKVLPRIFICRSCYRVHAAPHTVVAVVQLKYRVRTINWDKLCGNNQNNKSNS